MYANSVAAAAALFSGTQVAKAAMLTASNDPSLLQCENIKSLNVVNQLTGINVDGSGCNVRSCGVQK